MLYHCDRWYGNFTGRDTDAFYDERRDRRIWLSGNSFDASHYHADLQWHDQSAHALYATNHVEYAFKAETAKCGQGITGYDIHDCMDGAGDQRIYPVFHDQHLPGKRCGLGFYYSICGSADSDDHLLYSRIPEA